MICVNHQAIVQPRLLARAALLQVSLVLFVLAHAIGKLTAIPLLLKTSPVSASLPWWRAPIALHLLYKLARRDFQYWTPTAGAGVSLVSRVFRLHGDFSANPHLRHPFEIGGAAYLLMLCEM